MLPKNLKYSASKVESASCRSYRSNIQPQNGSGNYNLGDTIIINVPTRSNLCLSATESFLKFSATFTSTGANNVTRWDSCGAHGLIQRIRIFHGSNLIEDQDSYGLLAKFLFDMQVSTDASYGKHNILSGTRNDLVATLPISGTPAAAGNTAAQIDTAINTALATITAAPISILQVNSGESLGTIGAGAGAAVKFNYCINLISLLGTLAQNSFIPLWAMTSAPLRMEIQLVDSAFKAVACSGAMTSVVLNDVEYVGSFMELSDSAISMVHSSLNGSPLSFVVPSYKNYQFTAYLTGNNTQVSFPIPAKFSSLRALYVFVRETVGAATIFPFSCVTRGLIDYNFRVGSVIMPSKSPSTIPDFFSELLKSVSSMSDLNHAPSIEKASYSLVSNVANNAAGTISSGSFYLGLDLENYSGADKSTLFSGWNSNTDDIYFVGTFAPQGTALNVRMDSFALIDSVVVCDQNTCYVKF